MTKFTLTTTDAEDAAILALTASGVPGVVPEDVLTFLARQLRFQIDRALARAAQTSQDKTTAALAIASPQDQAAVTVILAKYIPA